jgi:hypothetical protein
MFQEQNVQQQTDETISHRADILEQVLLPLLVLSDGGVC